MPRIRDLGISAVPAPMLPQIGFNAASEVLYLSCTDDTTCGEDDSTVDPCVADPSCSEDTAQCIPNSGEPGYQAGADQLAPAVIAQLKQHLQERLRRAPLLN